MLFSPWNVVYSLSKSEQSVTTNFMNKRQASVPHVLLVLIAQNEPMEARPCGLMDKASDFGSED